jgi:hypothetical protein
MQFEGMAELIPPLIDADAAKLPPMGGRPMDAPNSTPIYTSLTDVIDRNRACRIRSLGGGLLGLTILSRGLTLNLSDF